MTVLVLRLAAPLQSWGTSSRFVRRNTDRVPSKSGVIGLLAAAQGRRRTDPVEDLLGTRLGIRVEHPGRLERDFQTAAGMPLSYRQYLADAAFLAVVEGEADLLAGLAEALGRPVFPLYLGRRSCPPVGPVSRGLRDGGLGEVLVSEPWTAPLWVQRQHGAVVELTTVVDCPPGEPGSDLVRDEPLSFDPRRRAYGWRSIMRGTVQLQVAAGGTSAATRGSSRVTGDHDPFVGWDAGCF